MNVFGIEITKREILASITIIGVMAILGILIDSKMNEAADDKSYTYNNSLQIKQDKELFEYGMNTSVGNALIYGKLTYVDSVSYPGIKGKYMFIKKVKEVHTAHTRTVRNGKTTTVHTYYTWDEVDSELKQCKEVQFCDVKFNISELDPYKDIDLSKITIVKQNMRVRYVYYGYVGSVGTLFCNLKNNKLHNTVYYENYTIDETLDSVEPKIWKSVLFWICWIFVIAYLVYRFCAFENRWLE